MKRIRINNIVRAGVVNARRVLDVGFLPSTLLVMRILCVLWESMANALYHAYHRRAGKNENRYGSSSQASLQVSLIIYL